MLSRRTFSASSASWRFNPARRRARSLWLLALAALPACGAEIKKENETLKARMAEREAENARMDEAKRAADSRIERLQKEIEDLKAKFQAQSERLAELQSATDRSAHERDGALDDLRRTKTSLGQVRTELGRLQTEHEELSREIDRLRQSPASPERPGEKR